MYDSLRNLDLKTKANYLVPGSETDLFRKSADVLLAGIAMWSGNVFA